LGLEKFKSEIKEFEKPLNKIIKVVVSKRGELRTVSVKMPEELLEMVDEIAVKERVSRSEIIRRAVAAYVDGKVNRKMWRVKRVVLG